MKIANINIKKYLYFFIIFLVFLTLSIITPFRFINAGDASMQDTSSLPDNSSIVEQDNAADNSEENNCSEDISEDENISSGNLPSIINSEPDTLNLIENVEGSNLENQNDSSILTVENLNDYKAIEGNTEETEDLLNQTGNQFSCSVDIAGFNLINEMENAAINNNKNVEDSLNLTLEAMPEENNIILIGSSNSNFAEEEDVSVEGDENIVSPGLDPEAYSTIAAENNALQTGKDLLTTQWWVSPKAEINNYETFSSSSPENPFNVYQILKNISEGSSIYFLPGIYNESINLDGIKSGNIEKPINFIGYDGTVFDGQHILENAFHYEDPLNYLGFYNFIFINYTGSAISIKNEETTGIKIIDNTFDGNAAAIEADMNSNLNIRENIIINNNEGIKISSNDANIENNLFSSNDTGIAVDGKSGNINVSSNDFFENKADFSGVELKEIASNNKINSAELSNNGDPNFYHDENNGNIYNNIFKIVDTDKVDYKFNEQVILSGKGYMAQQELTLKIIRPDGTFVDDIYISADKDGCFIYDDYIVDYAGKNYLVEVTDSRGNILEVLSFTDSASYYVSASGSDSAGNGTQLSPWASISMAINSAAGGDSINISDGTYNLSSKTSVNKEDLIITGNVLNPEKVKIIYASSVDPVFEINSSGCSFKGITTVKGKSGFIINNSVSDIIISSCIISDSRGDGIDILSASNILIEKSFIINPGKNNTDGEYNAVSSIANNLTVSNCTISSDSATNMKRAIYLLGGSNILINSNIISDSFWSAISASPGISNITISGNDIDNAAQTTANAGACKGAVVLDGDNNDSFITNNRIDNVAGSGAIRVKNSLNINIIGNFIGCDNSTNNIQKEGIYIFKCGSNEGNKAVITNNTINNTGGSAISLIDSLYAYIYKNTISNCNTYDSGTGANWNNASIKIESGSAGCLIDSNIISDGINGIQTWADNTSILNNEIYNMGMSYSDFITNSNGKYNNCAIIIGSNWLEENNKPTGITINRNNIHDNYFGLYIRDYQLLSPFDNAVLSVSAENNYWGRSTGPANLNNAGGLGDLASDNVDYSPWLLASYQMPASNFTSSMEAINQNQSVNFDAGLSMGVSSSENPMFYSWDWEGDDIYDEITLLPAISHIFKEAGLFNIRLKVTDYNGDISVSSLKVKVALSPVESSDDPEAISENDAGNVNQSAKTGKNISNVRNNQTADYFSSLNQTLLANENHDEHDYDYLKSKENELINSGIKETGVIQRDKNEEIDISIKAKQNTKFLNPTFSYYDKTSSLWIEIENKLIYLNHLYFNFGRFENLRLILSGNLTRKFFTPYFDKLHLVLIENLKKYKNIKLIRIL